MTAPGEASRAESARSQPQGGGASAAPPSGEKGQALARARLEALGQARLAALAHARLGALVQLLDVAALVEDGEGRIVDVNEAFVDLLGLEVEVGELVGAAVGDLCGRLPPQFAQALRASDPERLERISSGDRPVWHERMVLPDGRVLGRDSSPVRAGPPAPRPDGSEPAGDGQPTSDAGRVFLFRDESSDAETEAEWQQLLETQRAENKRLTELDRVKSEFLAEISHELRTPLTSILSFTDLLSSGLGHEDPDEQREFVEVIGRNASRLLRLVDDLLLLDRIERGALPVERRNFDVPSVVASAVSSFTPAANRKGISLESELGEGPPLCGDAQRIAQLLDVIISNAVKFTPEGGRVVVTAGSFADGWSVEVADSGIGVPPRERTSLFERFYRASNARDARLPGSGLGLSIARAIAELHGGTIELLPARPRGTLVRLVLPHPRSLIRL